MTPPARLTWRERRAMKRETRAELAAIVDPMPAPQLTQSRGGMTGEAARGFDRIRARLAVRRVIVQAVKAPTFAAVVGGLVLVGLALALAGYAAGRAAGAYKAAGWNR